MTIDQLVKGIIAKRNPCIVGIDPEWDRLPQCYQTLPAAQGLLQWGQDVIDAVADIVPAIKPQMAFFEVFGPDGLRVHRQLTDYAHGLGLLVIDDSKRNDIGNTARAYAYAHLAKAGPINADFLTINPFLGYDSMQPFLDTAAKEGKGLFVLVKTSNPGSRLLSEAVCESGEALRNQLAAWVNSAGMAMVGQQGYSALGAVVGATYPEEAADLRQCMPRSFFLVPGFGAQGGTAEDVLPCFDEHGLGAVVSSSRGILYCHETLEGFDHSRDTYRQAVQEQARQMQRDVYRMLRQRLPHMSY